MSAHLEPHVFGFLTLQVLNTKPAELLEQGRRHLEFACSLAESQIERGGRALFEHPWTATSWNERKLLANDGMRRVRCDQCQFGMTSVDGAGNVGPAQKATGFTTNDEYTAEAVNRRCFGGHDHIQLLTGRAKSCVQYPPRERWQRYCALCDRAWDPRDAAKLRK